MLSSLHNRFSVATDTKFGAIPPTFPLKAEDKEPAENYKRLLVNSR